MKKSISAKTAERLSTTPEGLALLAVITHNGGTPSALAAKLKIAPQTVRQWIYSGAIPKQSAAEIAKSLNVKPATLRPDLPLTAWVVKVEQEKPAREPVARTEDAKLLVRLADKLGGVKQVCEAAFCTVGDYHTWKHRGRIPAIKLPTFLALEQ